MYPAFLVAPTFVVLVACIRYYAADDKKLFSQIGLSFAVVYAAVIMIDYFIQWIVIEPSILSGETAGLALFTQYNPHGILVALESLGYLAMNGALLYVAAVFARGKTRARATMAVRGKFFRGGRIVCRPLSAGIWHCHV
jgi:hypothetical protein